MYTFPPENIAIFTNLNSDIIGTYLYIIPDCVEYCTMQIAKHHGISKYGIFLSSKRGIFAPARAWLAGVSLVQAAPPVVVDGSVAGHYLFLLKYEIINQRLFRFSIGSSFKMWKDVSTHSKHIGFHQ